VPYDDLALNPKDRGQSMRSWLGSKWRNPVTHQRKTIYVGTVPSMAEAAPFMRNWTCLSSQMLTAADAKSRDALASLQPPTLQDTCDYLRAFYHPLTVKVLPGPVAFVPWTTGRTRPRPEHVGLQIGDGVTRIRTRPTPDKAFERQLNLSDILDAGLSSIPKDAYALVLMVDHDMFEDEEDDFCCGRAYGGSRISVVSSARYHPGLDRVARDPIDHHHMWPASHCKSYVDGLCGVQPPKARSNRSSSRNGSKRKADAAALDVEEQQARPSAQAGGVKIDETPLGAAVRAALEVGDPMQDLYGLWLSRVARTISHELGHCFSFGHCVYYACAMQGTAGITEDMRQPPYLCPVCLARTIRAIGDVNEGVDERDLVLQRYRALSEFCKRWPKVGMFAGFDAWLGQRMLEYGAVVSPTPAARSSV